MNKIATILLALITAFGLVHCSQQEDSPLPRSSRAHLERVPDDTLVFFGGLEPFPMRKVLDTSPDYGLLFDRMQWQRLYKEMKIRSASDVERMLVELVFSYVQNLAKPDEALAKFGFADEFHITFYTVGVTPVLRMSLADKSAFQNALAEIEANAGVSPTDTVLEKIAYRAYAFGAKDLDDASAYLIVAYDADDVVLTVDLGDPDALAIALGARQPDQSLADSGKIQAIIDKYDYSVGYGVTLMDHQEILTALTSANNQAGEMLQGLLRNHFDGVVTATLRNPICAEEFSDIAATWPRTVAGYREMNVDTEELSATFHAVLEIDNESLLATLRKYRGFIPTLLREEQEAPFILALGLDVNNLGEAMGELLRYMREWDYQCPALRPLNRWAEGTQTWWMKMALGVAMVQGLKGVSVVLLDMDLDATNAKPNLQNVDALLAIAAENPRILLGRAASFIGNIEIPDDGTPVDVRLPIPMSSGDEAWSLKVASEGNHITLFAGEKAGRYAQQLQSEDVDANGLMYYKMDYRAYMDFLTQAARYAPNKALTPENVEAMEMIKSFNAVYDSFIDITDSGFELVSYLKTKQEPSQ